MTGPNRARHVTFFALFFFFLLNGLYFLEQFLVRSEIEQKVQTAELFQTQRKFTL